MRLAGIVVVACMSCTVQQQQMTCGTSAPRLAACVQHGFATIDLDGTWTLTGQSVTMGSGAPVTMPIQQTMMFAQSGCFLLNGATLDDTNAVGSWSSTNEHEPCLSRSNSSLTLCAAADGTVQYDSSDTFSPFMGICPSASSTHTTGTLMR